jgi:hypothetical protein
VDFGVRFMVAQVLMVDARAAKQLQAGDHLTVAGCPIAIAEAILGRALPVVQAVYNREPSRLLTQQLQRAASCASEQAPFWKKHASPPRPSACRSVKALAPTFAESHGYK